MEFLESPRFPGCPSFGYTSIPRYSVTRIVFPGGQTDRNRNWVYPLQRIDVTVGPRMEAEIQEILEFWHALGGEECGFRFKDYADFKSCRVGETATALDQPLTADGTSSEAYQLFKVYTAGAREQLRIILKPVSGTIRVANEFGAEQSASTWSLDTSTGLLTPTVGFVGTPTTWGGEFDLPVCFDGEFPVEIVNQRIQSVSFSLEEVRL